MRIAFIAGEYPPSQGGLGDYTRELARALVNAGHEPHIITKAVPGTPSGESGQGVRVHRIIPKWNWQTIRYVRRFLRDYQPDVLCLQYQAAAYTMHVAINLLPGLLSPHIPVVVTFHDLRAPYLFPKAGPVRKQMILHMSRCAAATIVTNAEDRDELARAHIRNVNMIPIGSNIHPWALERFDKADWMRANAIPPNTRLVGYFGFLNESKGGETLVRALAQLRGRAANSNVKLLLIGGQVGESDLTNVAYARHLMRLADSLYIREHLISTGFMDEHGVSAAFAACDCIALPYRDGASFRRGTLMAALEHGCAVVTTTPSIFLPELIHETNILLVPPERPFELADAIARVLSDDLLRTRLQLGSRQLSMRFTWDHIASDTVSVFENTLQR